MNNLPAIPMADMQVMARAFATSGLFGVKNEAQALALCLVAQSEGIHPARAVQEFHIVEGRPCLSSNAALSRFMAAGGKIRWDIMTDEKVEGTAAFNGESLTLSWDTARAKAAGLANRPNYSKFPRQMLKARCAAELIRAIAPGTLSNFYVKEEMEGGTDYEPERAVQINSEPVLTIEARTTHEAASVIKDALAGKKTAPSKPMPAPKEAVVEGGNAAEVITDIKKLSEVIKETPLSIVKRLSKGTVNSLPAVEKLPLNHLQRLAELVKKELVAESAAADSFDPFAAVPEPEPIQDALFEVAEENPFELPD